MSLILDALNRSESDRADPAATPGLQSVHGPRNSTRLPLWRRLLWPSLAVVFGAVALGLWYTGHRAGSPAAGDPAAGAPAAVTAEKPPSRAADPASAPAAPAVAPPAATPQAATPQVATTPDRREPAPPATDMQTVTSPPAAKEAPAVAADVAALYRAQAQARAAPPVAAAPAEPPASAGPRVEAPAASQSLDVNALTRAAEAALEQRDRSQDPVVEHSAPFITELRQQIKDQIPTIFYSEHNWASVPAERSVVLNRQRFTEGQQVKPGLRLLEILPDSIVLEFQGTEFRLQSLNSWVNL